MQDPNESAGLKAKREAAKKAERLKRAEEIRAIEHSAKVHLKETPKYSGGVILAAILGGLFAAISEDPLFLLATVGLVQLGWIRLELQKLNKFLIDQSKSPEATAPE